MGIRGLKSLVKGMESYKPARLHSTFLVVDGRNISIELYTRFCPTSALNGDYNKYALCVKDFFTALLQFNIYPIVILDGAHEDRKHEKTETRMQAKIIENNNIQNVDVDDRRIFYPALVIEVFKDVMRDMNVLFCQSCLEADLCIVKIAQFLNCPVLSEDADFYFDDVRFIPFSTIYWKQPKPEERGSTNSFHIIEGEMFDRKHFFNILCGTSSLDPSFFPLLAFLLGNDYSEPQIYTEFVRKITRKEGDHEPGLKRKISCIYWWLQRFNSPKDAVDSFLKEIPGGSRKKTKKELTRCLKEKKLDDNPNYLVKYILHSIPSFYGNPLPEYRTIEGSADWLKDAVPHMHGTKVPIPEWILKLHVQGKLHRKLMDLFYTRSFFWELQMEDPDLESVNPRTLEILQNILGIIYPGNLENSDITLYCRVGSSLERKSVTPERISDIPTLSEVFDLLPNNRKTLFLKVMDMKLLEKEMVPESWMLFFCTLADWYRQGENSDVTKTALGCIIFSSIFVEVVDKMREGNPESVNNNNETNFKLAIENIDFDDCSRASAQFEPFFDRFYSKQFKSGELVKPILHCFAGFQNHILVVEILNSVLNFPFSSVKIADVFCGTFAYNIYFEIKEFDSLEQFIKSKFSGMPTLQELFFSTIRLIENLSECTILTSNKVARKRPNLNEADSSTNCKSKRSN